MKKHLLNIAVGLGCFCILAFLLLLIDGKYDYRRGNLYDTLNTKREQEISSIKNKIEAYKTANHTFPIAKNFDELKGVIGYIENDVRYHYSYESNGIYYIFSYPEDTMSGVKCKIIKMPEITEVSPADKERLCNLAIKKRVSGEKE